jgi:hypothetical protein
MWHCSSWSSIGPFISALYGVDSHKESSDRIVQAACSQPPDHTLIVIGHNAPYGKFHKHKMCQFYKDATERNTSFSTAQMPVAFCF